MAMKTRIHHWRFEDGNTCPNPGHTIPLSAPPRGWYCWVYPDNDHEFEKWMFNHCPTADVTHRFNSGDPMYTVFIKDPQEATLFQLKYGDGIR